MKQRILKSCLQGAAASPALDPRATTSSVATCSPTPIPDRTYKLELEKGFGWNYYSITPDYRGPTIDVSPDEAAGIKECKSWCAADVNCRTCSYFVWTEADLGAGCLLFSVPYNESYFAYDATVTSPLNYTKVYSVTNWSPPAKLLPNGGFERGCLDPWWQTSRPTIDIGVVRCNRDVKDDCSEGVYYLQLKGTDPPKQGFGGASVQPAVFPGETYEFTAYVKGAAGSDQEKLVASYENMVDIPEYVGTGKWEKVGFVFNGSYGGQLGIAASATKSGGLVDWKVDNCKIEKLSE